MALRQEVRDAETESEQAWEHFNKCTEKIKVELQRFEAERIQDIQKLVRIFLRSEHFALQFTILLFLDFELCSNEYEPRS